MELQVGQVVKGEVTGIKAYGAFVRLPTDEIGMVHISEIAQEYVRDIGQYLAIGQAVMVKIIAKNVEGKCNLSLKQITKQEEEAAQYENKVEEFKKALAEREPTKEIQEEIIRDLTPKKETRPSQESLIAWLNTANKHLAEQERHRQWRYRFYQPDWQQADANRSSSSPPRELNDDQSEEVDREEQA
ncbi:S1 RNA-binding domain-containing protein [Candidatus Acetothermia bacterium]|nr:S1 RNA-binding domain-containing protein [Candidatus Acetothermia bacterium]MBI3460403.1 S1 RNA-binding domain-containing protein [Candidatus Acetothermia bacterium]MBI3661283.1 S1 RNA-binding domain-containing protein [Candidatus Acetothermia bacterium]